MKEQVATNRIMMGTVDFAGSQKNLIKGDKNRNSEDQTNNFDIKER